MHCLARRHTRPRWSLLLFSGAQLWAGLEQLSLMWRPRCEGLRQHPPRRVIQATRDAVQMMMGVKRHKLDFFTRILQYFYCFASQVQYIKSIILVRAERQSCGVAQCQSRHNIQGTSVRGGRPEYSGRRAGISRNTHWGASLSTG